MRLPPRFLFATLLFGGLLASGRAPMAYAWNGAPVAEGSRSYVLNADDSLDYWDGKHQWRQLADGRIYVWADRRWVPGGAIFWGMNDGFGPPPQPARGGLLGIPGRLNLDRDEYRRRYGQDNYFIYGPGHFGNG